MNKGLRCPHCGRILPAGRLDGLCTACLLRSALEDQIETRNDDVTGTEGLRFGPYSTMGVIGKGGMGVVYLARQEQPIHRTVALKVIKQGMGSHETVARFESERDALALMDHPNIARVFDAGTSDDGRPYFAMEYVPGVPIVEFCDVNRLSTRKRLEVFRQVCLGIHHAHQKGIVHRDIKPSNVLVEVQDGKPMPKVIDFGVAKAIRQGAATEETLFTQAGVLIGTPEYMSPEQAQLTPHDVDTATDIYSLGVLLYELLVGALPFEPRELRRAGFLEILRRIREEEPPPPAGRLKTLGATASEVATRRQTDIRTLERQLRGDLEWITMRAIEKDRARRYPSASEFAADISRHLADDPVVAGPPGRLYHLRKFVRKNRVPIAAAAGILVCLVAGLAMSTALYFRAERHRDLAERESYVANLANADSLLEACDYQGARERLFRCAPRLRGWEWRLLYGRSDTSVARLQGTGDPRVDYPGYGHFAFSSDGRKFFYCMDRTVHSWSIPGWEPAGEYGVFGHILGIAQDGSRIVTRSASARNPELLVVETVSGKTLARLGEHPGAAWAAFDSDGGRAATEAADGSVRLWDLAGGRLVADIAATGRSQARLFFSPDGAMLAATGPLGSVRLISTRTGKLLRTLSSPTAVFGIAFSPDGKSVATADATSLALWDTESGEERQRWREVDALFAVAFSPDGARIVTGAQNRAVRIWDPKQTGTPFATLPGNLSRTAAVAFSRDGRWVFSGSADGEVSIWSAVTYGQTALAARSTISGATATSAEDRLTYARDRLTALGVDSGWPAAPGAVSRVWAMAFACAGTRVAIGHRSGTIYILDTRSGASLLSWKGHKGPIRSVAYSHDGRYVASGSSDGTAAVWEASSGRRIASMQFTAPVNDLAFSPDGSRLATAVGNPSGSIAVRHGVSVWDPSSGKLLYHLPGESNLLECGEAVAFSADGKRLAASDSELSTVRVGNALTGRLLAAMKGHRNQLSAVVFSPDGRLLASSARDNTIRLWDAIRYEPLFVIRRPPVMALDLAFSGDGNTLYSHHLDGSIRIWSTNSRHPVRASELVAQLRQKYERMADLREQLEASTRRDHALRTATMRAGASASDLYTNAHVMLLFSAAQPRAGAGELASLLRRAQDLISVSPWSVESWSLFGAALYRHGRYAEAVAHLARASAVQTEDFPAVAFLAMAYQRTGQIDKAREALEKARALLSGTEPYHRELMSGVLAEAEALLSGGGK